MGNSGSVVTIPDESNPGPHPCSLRVKLIHNEETHAPDYFSQKGETSVRFSMSINSQFHQPTCCFSSEAGNLSRAFSADFMTQFLPSRDPQDPTDRIVISVIGLRLWMTSLMVDGDYGISGKYFQCIIYP